MEEVTVEVALPAGSLAQSKDTGMPCVRGPHGLATNHGQDWLRAGVLGSKPSFPRPEGSDLVC